MINFSDWFQLNPYPMETMVGNYDWTLVGLSYLVAVLASYAAVNIVGQLRSEQNPKAKIYWLAGGAFTLGAGIWSMHFIGMLAFIMPMPMEYELNWTLASLFMAILASGFALFILQKQNYTIVQFTLGGLIIGLAISTMHYMGMEGMKIHTHIHYIPSLFILSIFISIIAAEAALFLALKSNQGSSSRQFNLKIISALIMGFAICGMHYTGMAAAIFTPIASHGTNMGLQAIQANYLAFFIAGITALIITQALTASISYKKMGVAVENEKNFLKAMLDNIEDGIIACDAEGRVTVLNRSLQECIPLSKRHIHIDYLEHYFTLATLDNKPLAKENWPLNLALKGQPIHNLELIMVFKNQITRDVVVNGQTIINSEGKNLGAVAVIHDITKLKKTEKIKHEFVSIVSHELRTPLTSIRGSLGLLVSGIMGEFPEKAKKLIEIANNNCERLLLLINDILDIDKIEAGKMDFELKNHDLKHIITESIVANKIYADKYNVSIELIPTPSFPAVYVDSSRLMQVLVNLISNACKFSPSGDKVTVSIEPINSMVRVSVSDNGPGIPEEFQPRIFQKFSQADSSDTRGKGGTGLGLNISKNIIEQLNGTINFFSSPDSGTTFYFELPIADDIIVALQEKTDLELITYYDDIKLIAHCSDEE